MVEVGINIPSATLIVIEEANKFGLAQLHQLRGRISRSTKPSNCILMHNQNLSELSLKRLLILRNSEGLITIKTIESLSEIWETYENFKVEIKSLP